MTCQDCERFLSRDRKGAVLAPGQGERDAEMEEHLLECAECRALHEDLRANSAAFESLRNEELPRIAVKIPRRGPVYPWVYPCVAGAAAAAMVIWALLTPRPQAVRPVTPQVAEEPAQPPRPLPMLAQAREPAKAQVVRHRPQKVEPMKIKMLTPDPDVVIYWLVGPNQGD